MKPHFMALSPCAQVDNVTKQVDNMKSLHQIPVSKFCVQISQSRLVLSRYRVIAFSRYGIVFITLGQNKIYVCFWLRAEKN